MWLGNSENALLCGRYDRSMSASIRKNAQSLGFLPSLAYSLVGSLGADHSVAACAATSHARSSQWAVDAHQSKRLIQSSLYWGSGSSEAFLVVDLALPLATISPVLVALEGDMVCSYLSLRLLLGVGAYAVVGWWWADPVGALAMLPIILWQGWETLAEARERADRKD